MVKLFALCFFALFIIPSLLKLLSEPGEKSSNHDYGEERGNGREPLPVREANNIRQLGGDSSLSAVFKEGELGNYEDKNPERREGPGEGGVAVQTEPEARGRADATVREFGFNMYASDKISLDRRIKDTRPAE